MAGPFKLRSQGSSFKQMGSSPAKKELTQEDEIARGVVTAGTKDKKSTKPKKSGTDYAAMQAKGSDRYKKLSAADYKAEVDRQVKSKKEGKGYNAHKYDSKGELAKDFDPKVNKYNKSTADKTDKTDKTETTSDSTTRKKRTKVGKFFTKVRNRILKGDSKKGVAIEAKDTEYRTLTKKQAKKQAKKKAIKDAKDTFKAKKEEIKNPKEA